MKTLRILGTTLFCFLMLAGGLSAQATLSFQGILKKSNGIAVDDGEYSLKFSLYDTEQGGTAIWSETQTNVEINSGIYSVLLGSTNPITASFNSVYYLGVKVGGTPELTPRLRLTSAPYALSLIGQSNLFPSTGTVKSDELVNAGKMVVGGAALSPTHTLLVTGGVLARSGAPGANGDGNHGYAFDNDKDSGLFSTADGEVSVYVNNAEKLKVTASNVAISGDLSVGNGSTPGNVNLSKGSAIAYNGNKDWQLVVVDNCSSTTGWNTVLLSPLSRTFEQIATASSPPVFIPTTMFANDTVVTGGSNERFSKMYNLQGIPHNHVKVEFVLVFWSFPWTGEFAWAGFKEGNNELRSFTHIPSGFSTVKGEMEVLNHTGNSIDIYFGSNVAGNGKYLAVSNVEVYVK